MKKLLVTLDGSDLAESAFPVAKDLAASSGASLVLLTVGNLPETGLQSREEEQDLSVMLSRVAKRFDLKAEVRVEMDGDPVTGILGAADEEDADIITMATHGRSGLSQFVHVGTATGVPHDGRRPVLLVHPRPP